MIRQFTERTKVLAISHVSNTLGTINPMKELITEAKKRGIITVVDGAQAIAHLDVDVQDLGCDLYAFSGHKANGPTGAVVGGMVERKYGRIIYVTSAAGVLGTIGQINYSAAKAGILGMTKSTAKELARYNITANAIAPGAATPMTEVIRTDEKFKDKYLDRIPLGRWAEPEEIAPVFLFFASDASAYVTGQILAADGGMTIH